MVPRTRRQFLALAGGTGAISVAGCNSGKSADAVQRTEGQPSDGAAVVTDPPHHVSRIEQDLDNYKPVAEYSGETDGRTRYPYVIREDDIEALTFDPRPPDYDEVKAFLAETDYHNESVFLANHEVDACHRVVLNYAQRRGRGAGAGYAVHLCQVMREPAVDCSVDEMHHQLVLVRLPVAYDEPPSGSGGGWARSCSTPPGHPARNGGNNR